MSEVQLTYQGGDEAIRRLDPVSLARTGRCLRIEMPLSAMTRLEGLVVSSGKDLRVTASFDFSVDDDGHSCVEGEIRAQPELVCQRCLSPVSVPLRSQVRWMLVADEDDLPADYERLQTEDGRCDLHELIEDELLLAMPIVAMHEISDCAVGDEYRRDILVAGEAAQQEAPTQRPFAGLAELLAQKDKP